jgi:hypothetical protein
MAWPDNAPVYSIVAANITVIANQTLIMVHTAASGDGSRIALCRAWAGQSGTASSDQELIQIQKYNGVGTLPTVITYTPQPLILDGGASGIVGGATGAAGTAGYAAAAEGSAQWVTLWGEGFNNLNGWLWLPTQDQYIIVPPNTTVALRFTNGSPNALTGWTFGLIYIEIN